MPTTEYAENCERTSEQTIQPKAKPLYYGPPPKVWDNKLEEREYLKGRLALAFRIMAQYEYFVGLAGHITIRDPVEPETFLMNPFGIHFALITAGDIVRVDHEGNVLDGGKPDRNWVNRAGLMIHTAVHEARPEVNAVVHSHATMSKAWCSLNAPLPLLSQDSCAFYNSLGVDDQFGGIALDPDEGKRIASVLGDKPCALLGNHGSITCGKSVESAICYFLKLEKECEVVLNAYAAAAKPGAPQPKEIPELVAKFTNHGPRADMSHHYNGLPYFEYAAKASLMSPGGPYNA